MDTLEDIYRRHWDHKGCPRFPEWQGREMEDVVCLQKGMESPKTSWWHFTKQ